MMGPTNMKEVAMRRFSGAEFRMSYQ